MRFPACASARYERFLVAVVPLLLLDAVGCVPRPRMCAAKSECDANSACVAGRCQLEKATAKPAVDTARRLVVRPVDLAYLRSGDGPSGGALPPLFALGKDGGRLFLRFSVAVPAGTNVVEAYVVLRRASVVDDDPAPISLHATRIVEAWQGGSISWALQPRGVEARLPSTVVESSGTSLVRIDVRDLVRLWGRHDPADQGIAIVADGDTRTGTTFALNGIGVERTDVGGVGMVLAPNGYPSDVAPYLELYVR